jgi:hypothetical protein
MLVFQARIVNGGETIARAPFDDVSPEVFK